MTRPENPIDLPSIARAWADQVLDLRTASPPTDDQPSSGGGGAGLMSPVPGVLPDPVRQAEVPLPETVGLPCGGAGGRFTLTLHLTRHHPTHCDLVTVATYPDGFRLGVAHRVDRGRSTSLGDRDEWPTSEGWVRRWLGSKTSGLGCALLPAPNGWCLAQRAWAVRRWVEDSIPVQQVEDLRSGYAAATHGFTVRESFSALSTWCRPDSMHVLQGAGFWFPDETQVAWLTAGTPPLASAPTSRYAARLAALCHTGWSSAAYQRWREQHFEVSDAIAASSFLDYATHRTQIVQTAMKMSGVQGCDDEQRVGEIANLCVLLGLSEFEIGVMVGERTFSLDALRVLSGLTRPVSLA